VDEDYHDSLKATWEGLKARNIGAYDPILTHSLPPFLPPSLPFN